MPEPIEAGPAQDRAVARVPAALHDLLFDRYADAVLVADADGRYVEANLAATTLLGYPRAELLAMQVTDVLVFSERGEAEFARFTAEGYWRGAVELRRKDGSTVLAEARATMLETPEGTWGVSIMRESGEPLQEALAASEAQFQAIVQSSEDAIFSGNTDGRIWTWNGGAERIFGYTADEAIGQHVSLIAPPERRHEVDDNIRRVMAGEHVRDFETTRMAKDGRRVQVSLSVSPIRGPGGELTGVAAIARDVTEQREAERRAHILYELTHLLGRAESHEGVFVASLDALQRALHTDRTSILLFDDERVMRFRAWRGLSARYRAAVEGHNPWASDDPDPQPIHVPDVSADDSLREIGAVIRDEGIRSLSFIPLLHLGELFGKFMLYFDAPRMLGEIDRQLATSIASQTAFAIARLRTEAALAQAQAQLELITTGSADGLTIQDEQGRVIYANEAGARLSGFDSVEAFLAGAQEYRERWELLSIDGEPFEPDLLPGRRALNGEPHPEATLHIRDRRTGLEHWRQVRAEATEGVDGIRYAINLFHDVTEQRRSQDQLQFLAHTLQTSLLPSRMPDVEGIEIVAEYRAAGEGIEVGGDFYDLFAMQDGSWAVAVGDVCGKGPTAAAMTGVARHTMRAAAMMDASPSRVLSLVNEAILRDSPEERFCTILLARLTPREDRTISVLLSSGGHPPALVLRADGAVEEIDEPGTLLGLFEDPHLPEAALELAPGDSMILYTDGVTDEQLDGEEFGEARLHDLIRECRGWSPTEIAQRIVAEVETFSSNPPRDDIAVVVLRATG